MTTLADIPGNYADACNFISNTREKYLSCGYRTAVYRYLTSDCYDVALRHHETNIVVWHADDTATVNCNGWRSVTTKARINAALADSPWRIYSFNGSWHWYYYDGERCLPQFSFEDGDRVYLKHPSGVVPCAIFDAK